jgi:hypothetical protein
VFICLLVATALVLSPRANEEHIKRGHHTLVGLLDFVLPRMKILAGRSGVINSTLIFIYLFFIFIYLFFIFIYSLFLFIFKTICLFIYFFN